jgi:uncharacterized protein (TIGR03000 family)
VAPAQVAAAKEGTTSRVTVSLPSGARLWVENVELSVTSTKYSFNTPPLDPSRKYVYNMKLSVVHEGQTVTEEQRVMITPGQEARVDFDAVLAQRFSASR